MTTKKEEKPKKELLKTADGDLVDTETGEAVKEGEKKELEKEKPSNTEAVIKPEQEVIATTVKEVIPFSKREQYLSFITEDSLAKAKIMVKSGLLPDSVNTPEKAIVIMQKGKELGFQPMAAFEHIVVVNGRPSPDGAAIGTLLRRGGVEWEVTKYAEPIYETDKEDNIIWYVSTGSGDAKKSRKATQEEIATGNVGRKKLDTVTEIKFYRVSQIRSGTILEHVAKFSLNMAKRADLLKKDSWKKYWESMLYWRALSIGGRQIAPDLLQGMPSIEEIDDSGKYYFDEAGIARKVT